MHKEIREIVKLVKAQGYDVEQRTKYLWVVDPETGRLLVRLPSTPGGGRWKQNLLAELRREGIIP